MTEEERHRLTDAQIRAEMLNHSTQQRHAEALIEQNTLELAEINDALCESRGDRNLIRAQIEDLKKDTDRQFAGLAECVNEVKAWQWDQSRKKEEDKEYRAEREQQQDRVYQEIVKEFEFRRRLGKWRNSILVTFGLVLGLIVSGHSVWEMIKHLFNHPQP